MSLLQFPLFRFLQPSSFSFLLPQPPSLLTFPGSFPFPSPFQLPIDVSLLPHSPCQISLQILLCWFPNWPLRCPWGFPRLKEITWWLPTWRCKSSLAAKESKRVQYFKQTRSFSPLNKSSWLQPRALRCFLFLSHDDFLLLAFVTGALSTKHPFLISWEWWHIAKNLSLTSNLYSAQNGTPQVLSIPWSQSINYQVLMLTLALTTLDFLLATNLPILLLVFLWPFICIPVELVSNVVCMSWNFF